MALPAQQAMDEKAVMLGLAAAMGLTAPPEIIRDPDNLRVFVMKQLAVRLANAAVRTNIATLLTMV